MGLSDDASHFRAWLATTYGRAGMQEEARVILDDLHVCAGSQYSSPLWLAWIHIGLGDKERALDLLEKAAAERTPYLFLAPQDPQYRALWSDSRFSELVSKVGSGVVARGCDPLGMDGVSHEAMSQET